MERSEFISKIIPRPRLVYQEYNFERRLDSLLRIAQRICPEFVLDKYNTEIYEQGCRYFAADPACSWDINKGLFLVGPSGVGKTLFFKIFWNLLRAPGIESPNNFKRYTVNSIIDGYSSAGPAFWSHSSFNQMPSGYSVGSTHVFVDDLGQSSRIATYYGNSIDVIAELVQRRYYAFTEDWVLTHATSNLDPSEIKEAYGNFTSSRMREMFNVIPFPGEDRRK